MSNTNDGGPAFPGGNMQYPGMSLRGWFAGQALAGFGPQGTTVLLLEALERCDDTADTMLKKREAK